MSTPLEMLLNWIQVLYFTSVFLLLSWLWTLCNCFQPNCGSFLILCSICLTMYNIFTSCILLSVSYQEVWLQFRKLCLIGRWKGDMVLAWLLFPSRSLLFLSPQRGMKCLNSKSVSLHWSLPRPLLFTSFLIQAMPYFLDNYFYPGS